MGRSIFFLVLFFLLCFVQPSVNFAQDETGNASTESEAQEASVLDKMSDWAATLGKTDIEKEQILQERAESRNATNCAQGQVQAAKEKIYAGARDAKQKASQELASAKEKAGILKDEVKNKAKEKAEIAKQKVQEGVSQAKEKAASGVAACKEKLKKEADSSLDKAKDLLKNW